MVPLAALWLPILLSAIIVFVASSIMHMVLPYHSGHDDRVSQRLTGDGEVSGTVVCLLSDHWLFRGVSDGTHRRTRSHVWGGLSCSRHHGVYGLWPRKPEQRYLEGATLVDDHKGSHRRTCLRFADGKDIRLAVAALNKDLPRAHHLR